MKRYAAHYVFLSEGKIYKQYYIEIDAGSCITGVYPLKNEIRETVFCNGILFPVSKQIQWTGQEILEHLIALQNQYPSDSVFELLEKSDLIWSLPRSPVIICQLDCIDLVSLKLCTSAGHCNGSVRQLQ